MIGSALRTAAPPLERSCAPRISPSSRAGLRVYAQSLAQKGDILEVQCSRLAHAGQGVCFVGRDRTVLFCDGALPGERLTASVTKVHKTYLRGEKVSVIEQPESFVQPPCTFASTCGGCTLQQVPYALQVAAKTDRLSFEMAKIARLPDIVDVLRPVIAAQNPFHYRNRMSFMLASTTRGHVLALQQARSNVPVPVEGCMLQSSMANITLKCVNAALHPLTRVLSIYDARTRSGFLKRVVFRQGTSTQMPPDIIADDSEGSPVGASSAGAHFVVNFITNGRGTSAQQDALATVAKSICCGSDSNAQHMVTGVTQSIHVESNASAPPRSVECLRGHPYVYASVCGVDYRVSPNAFFQVNSEQVEHLFSQVVTAAKLKSSDVVLDLYCGTGAVALQLARQCHQVIGVDMVPAAIKDAEVNAQLNGITNVEFNVADLAGTSAKDRRVLAKLDAAAASVIVLDPGRSGLSSTVRGFVMSHKHATRIIYVSCNSEKLSRDLRVFCADEKWQCRMIQPVDMFPQTDHLEVVALLERSEP